MNDKKEVAVMPETALGPMASAKILLEKNVDLEKIEKMLELQAKWDAIQAEKAFTIAMTEFKSNAPVITRDKENSQYGSFYTTLGNLVNSSLPKMSECGLSHKWNVEQSEQIKVTCIVTHKDGHREPTSMSGPPDDSGKKNPIQQIKSTVTYLKAATFESAMGLASSDANVDDDGNGAGSQEVEYLDDKQKGTLVDMIADCGADEKSFLKYLEVESLDEVLAASYKKAIAALKAKKEQKKAEEKVGAEE